ncbi:MAG: hypothetical protein R3B70_01075 [Polyangiaceae bacterium]
MTSPRAAALLGLFSLVATACGSTTPAGGRPADRPPQLSRELDATDLLPSDLDVVFRVDVARLKAGLGPAAAQALAARAGQEGGDGFIAEAMAGADSVWIGLRLADLDAGDRVLVAEGRLRDIHLTPSEWGETTPAATIEGVRILDRKGIVPRASTGRIVTARGRLYAFISPAEIDATNRLLREGPDEARGDPAAVGLVSMDVRGHRLPPSLEKKYPSIAAVIAGVARVRGSATLADEGLRVDLDVVARSEPDAQRVDRFLSTVRDAAADSQKYAPLMKTAAVERAGVHVHVKLTVPAGMVIDALSEGDTSATR